MLARLLPALLLLLLAPAAAQAAAVKVPVPAEGQVAVTVASVAKKKVSLKVAKAPAALAVTGSAKRGRLAIAVIRPRGTYGTGSVTVKLRGGKAKGTKRFIAALDGGSAGAACKTLGTLLGKPLHAGGLAAGDLRAVGAAAAARLCGKPLPDTAAGVLATLGLGAPAAGGGGSLNPGGGGSQTPPPAPGGDSTNQCANGIDDDGDGQIDARENGSDPDPGCSGPADTSENSEVALPAGCTIELSVFNEDDLFPGIAVHGCGAIKGAWFKPSAEPTDCFYAVGAGDAEQCSVAGATAGATFPATTADVLLAMHTTTLPGCGAVTSAITLGNGTVAARREPWC